jgi:hypothetical protein
MRRQYVLVTPNDEEFAKAIIKLAGSPKENIIYGSEQGTTLLLPGVMEAGDRLILEGGIVRGCLAAADIRILSDVVVSVSSILVD